MDKRKVPKSTRLLKLVELFERGHVLDKKEIDTKMSSILGEDRSGLSLALYRDLQDLVTQGVLSQRFFRADGSELDSEDIEKEKYYASKWHLANLDHAVVGKGLLVESGGNLLLSSRLQKQVSVRESLPVQAKDFNIVFDPAGAKRLVFERGDLPITLLISRSTPQLVAKLFDELEAKFGRRLILLAFADPVLSAAKDPAKPGHLLLEIKADGSLSASDLSLRNPSFIAKREDAVRFWSGYLEAFQQTDSGQTVDQRKVDMSRLEFEKIPSAGLSSKLPAIIKISDSRTLLLG